MDDVVRVVCESCGYSRRVLPAEGKVDDLVIEAAGWTPGEPDGDRETWICEACAKK